MNKLSMMKEMAKTYCLLANNDKFNDEIELFFKKFMEFRYAGIAKISKLDIKDLYNLSIKIKAWF